VTISNLVGLSGAGPYAVLKVAAHAVSKALNRIGQIAVIGQLLRYRI
jgi:hypothetical protein